MARAGRMRPNTMSPGILTTPRVRPVSTITLSTTLVKRPKKAFQSPGTHQRTGCSVVVTLAMCPPVSSSWDYSPTCGARGGRVPSSGGGVRSCYVTSPRRHPAGCTCRKRVGPTPPEHTPPPDATRPVARTAPLNSPVLAGGGQHLEEVPGVRDPAEDASLRLDHGEGRVLELGEVRGDAVLQDEAVVTAIVGLADGGVEEYFGGDPASQEVAGDEMLQEADVDGAGE